MSSQDKDPFTLARDLAPEFEEMLEVKDLATQIDSLEGDLARISQFERRDLVLGDALGMAGLLISLVSLTLQIRSGNTYPDEPTEKIIERLSMKLSEQTSLPPKIREKLIRALIEKL